MSSIYDEPTRPERVVKGLPCSICHRGGAKPARVRVEISDKVIADERMDLCEECAGDRHRVKEAVRRIG